MKLRYRKLCERKKREEVIRWEKEVKEARTKEQIWKIINREKEGGSKRRNRNEGMGGIF